MLLTRLLPLLPHPLFLYCRTPSVADDVFYQAILHNPVWHLDYKCSMELAETTRVGGISSADTTDSPPHKRQKHSPPEALKKVHIPDRNQLEFSNGSCLVNQEPSSNPAHIVQLQSYHNHLHHHDLLIPTIHDYSTIPKPLNMAQPKIIDIPVWNVLSQVTSEIMNTAKDMRMSMDPWVNTKCTSVLARVSEALQSSDLDVWIVPPRTKEQKDAIRKMALENVANYPSSESSARSKGLPIRTPFPKDVEPSPPTPEMREALKKQAEEMMRLPSRQPYVLQVTATIAESTLAVVSGILKVRGVDAEVGKHSLQHRLRLDDMLWDTGSHGCTITSDLLSDEFREYLGEKEHDPYRDQSGMRVQVDGYLALSNSEFHFNAIFMVVPPSQVPNSRSGVILGQKGLIDRMVRTETPREILKHRGEDIKDHEWGTIDILEYIDPFGELVKF